MSSAEYSLYSSSNFSSSESDSDGSRVLSWSAIGDSLLEWLGVPVPLKESDRVPLDFSSFSLISICSTGRGTDSNSTRSLSILANRFFTSGSSRLHKQLALLSSGVSFTLKVKPCLENWILRIRVEMTFLCAPKEGIVSWIAITWFHAQDSEMLMLWYYQLNWMRLQPETEQKAIKIIEQRNQSQGSWCYL